MENSILSWLLFACFCVLGYAVEPASRPDVFGFSSIGGQETFDDDGDDVAVGDVTQSEIIASPATFENARPGTCCTLKPGAPVTWTAFASGAQAMHNQSQGMPLVIPCGTEVIVDSSIAETLPGIQVLGSLSFRDGIDITIKTDFIFVCGNFSIGSPEQQHHSKVEIVLTGHTNVTWPKKNGDVENFGYAGFVTYGGFTYISGSACGTETWSRLKRPIDSSSTDMELQDGSDLTWQPGDKVLVTTSSYSRTESEEVEISQVNGRVISFVGNLKYHHEGCDIDTQPGLECVIASEVARLSRNIVIRGEDDCAPKCGHFIIAHTPTGHFCGVEFTNLGQTAVEGRYPFHVHMPGNAPNMTVKDNSLHHNHNRGVVLHGVHNLTVANVTNYMTKGHMFMLEDGVEMDNKLILNLAVNTEPLSFGCKATHDMTFKCAHRSDHSPNAFWFPNPNNVVEGNVGVGVRGAFFFELRFVTGKVRLMFPEEAMKVGTKGKIKGRVGIGRFSNNMAHSCGGGIGNYPRMNFRDAANSPGYENFTAWRNGVGIAVHNSWGWPIVGARLIQNVAGLSAGTGKARFILRKSKIVAGKEGMDGTGRKLTVPFIMNKMGNTQDGHIERCFADTDSYTLSWIRCFGGYPDVAQSRFHSFIWNISTADPCDSFIAPTSPLKYVAPSMGVPEIEGYNFALGWIGGFPGGHKTEYTFEEAIEKCNSMGLSCGGVTCDTIEMKVCTVRAQRYVRKGKSDVTVSYLKDPDFVFPTPSGQEEVQDESTLWKGETTNHHCPFYRWTKVSNQWECQDACKKFALCSAIAYAPSLSGFSSDCYMCRDSKLIQNSKSFAYFPRPGGSTVESIAGYRFEEGWLGGYARGNQNFFSLNDAMDLCNGDYQCGGVTCTSDLYRCTIRAQKWIRGGSDSLTYVKASESDALAEASSYKVSGNVAMNFADTSFMNSAAEKKKFEESVTRTIVNVTALEDSSLFIGPDDISATAKLERRLKVVSRDLSSQRVTTEYTIAVSGSMMEARAEVAQGKVADVEPDTMLDLLSQNLEDVMGPSKPVASSLDAVVLPVETVNEVTSTTLTVGEITSTTIAAHASSSMPNSSPSTSGATVEGTTTTSGDSQISTTITDASKSPTSTATVTDYKSSLDESSSTTIVSDGSKTTTSTPEFHAVLDESKSSMSIGRVSFLVVLSFILA